MNTSISDPLANAGALLLAVLMFSPGSGLAQTVNSGCAELFDPRESGLPAPPAGQPKVTCAAFFPFAVALDGSEATRVEVKINGSGITAAALGNVSPVVGVSVDGVPYPQTGGFIDLFDDGTHGDRVAGDGIWSRGAIRADAVPIPPIRFARFDQLRYTGAGDTQTISIQATGSNGQYGPASMGQLDPALRAAARPIEPDLWVTDHVAFLVQADTLAELRWLLRARPPTADILSVGQRVFEKFPDAFDFLILNPGALVPGGLRGAYLSASNDVLGIGRPISDDTADWGSGGRLQGLLALNLTDGGPVIHEIGHRWNLFVGAGLGLQQCSPAHVGVAGTGCGPLGGFEAASLVDNGDGSWSVSNSCVSIGGAGADVVPFNPLNLYLMGLIPPSEVPPIPVPVNVDCNSFVQDFANNTLTFEADGMTTITIADLIAEHGPRIPDVSSSQRDFRLGWMVPINRVPTPTEAGWIQYRAEYISRQEVGPQPFRVTFWEATGGRATLETRLDGLLDGLFADSFETR
jgi:hypothetical protein